MPDTGLSIPTKPQMSAAFYPAIFSHTGYNQPYPPKRAAPHKAAAKISMWRAGQASRGSTLGEAPVWSSQNCVIKSLKRIKTESRMFYHSDSTVSITRHKSTPVYSKHRSCHLVLVELCPVPDVEDIAFKKSIFEIFKDGSKV
jgi:hypothetical protein